MPILFTTSRKPSRRTRAFARELCDSFPNTFFYSRGKSSITKLTELARDKGLSNITIILETKGNPSALRTIKLENNGWRYTYFIRLKLLKLRKELIGKKLKIDEIFLRIKTKKLKEFFRDLNIQSAKDSFVLKEKKNVLSFFYLNKEIGPRFEICEIKKLSL